MNSDTGLNAQNDSETIIINIPPLTEERRRQLVKQVKNETENAKVSIRSIRQKANDEMKKLYIIYIQRLVLSALGEIKMYTHTVVCFG